MNKIIILILLAFVFSCKQGFVQKQESFQQSPDDESLIETNKYLVEQDQELIKRYVERRNWDMTPTQTGLWYMIYEKGSGNRVQFGDVVTIDFSVELLDGTQCYSSAREGAKTFKVGQDNVESGLHQVIQLMTVGDKARIILPPHLAHGLLGDENKIPARSIIVYDVHLLEIK